jgi:hypothetical protein
MSEQISDVICSRLGRRGRMSEQISDIISFVAAWEGEGK